MATILNFFRQRWMRVGVISLGVSLKVGSWAEDAYAQQSQRVDVATIGGLTPLSAICENSTGLESSNFLIAGTGATNTVIITASTARVYLCALDITNGDSTTQVAIVSGDSTNCSTNSTVTVYNLSSYSGVTRGNGSVVQYKPISSNAAVCIKTASSGPVFGSLTFIKHGD
jgi:hypothetical protein